MGVDQNRHVRMKLNDIFKGFFIFFADICCFNNICLIFRAVTIILDIWAKHKVRIIVQRTCFSMNKHNESLIWKDCMTCYPSIPQPPPPSAGASGFIIFLSSESFSLVNFWRKPCYMCDYCLNTGISVEGHTHTNTAIKQCKLQIPLIYQSLGAWEYADYNTSAVFPPKTPRYLVVVNIFNGGADGTDKWSGSSLSDYCFTPHIVCHLLKTSTHMLKCRIYKFNPQTNRADDL